jgi:hypothetical protein
MKTWVTGAATLILSLRPRWRNVVSFKFMTLNPQQKQPLVLSTRLDEPHNRSIRCGEQNNLLTLPGVKPCSSHCPA